ncbi:MAG: MBL fold metallo-hydrolase [Coriobacteriia bacterium]|nr:MBL fold metallo-hydrolase [Coriobacteriia bacterium]
MGAIDAVLKLVGMQPLKTGKVEHEKIFALRSVANDAFLMPAKGGYIAIDAGNSVADILDDCVKIEVDPDKVTDLFLTHGDRDHLGGLEAFPNARVHIARRELKDAAEADRFESVGGGRFPVDFDAERLDLLEGGECLEVGGRTIEVISAPGHTVGHMAYLVDGKYLFTGDAFKLKGGKLVVHPATRDKAQAQKTIDELVKRFPEDGLVLTAHFGLLHPEEPEDTGERG